jgi:hypothetical protein
MPWRCIALLICLGASLSAPARSAASCIDVAKAEPIEVSGRLHHRSFSDDEIQTGAIDQTPPESAYVLKLDKPTCFYGDEFLGGEVTVSEVHLMINAEDNNRLFAELHELVGKDITVAGKRGFGAHTRHHRAPVVLVLTAVSENHPIRQEMAENVVAAFYLALGVGDGNQASRYIIPAKRRSGPLSAEAMSRFYGDLEQPLELLDVAVLDSGRYRAHYRFTTKGGARCNGSAIVSTTSVNGAELISRIVAERGC